MSYAFYRACFYRIGCGIQKTFYHCVLCGDLYAVLFMLSWFYGSGTTDIYADAFFEMFMLILSVPVWSYMPLAMRIAPNQGMMALFITAILVLINTAVSIWLTVSEKRGKKLE